MSRKSVVLVGVLFVLLAALALSPNRAAGSHFTNWLEISPPFAGYWDRFGLAPPSTHHRPWNGDWATDFYQAPGAAGAFRIADSAGGTAYGVVSLKGSSCLGSTWAGLAYEFNVYDGSGYRGWYLAAHVSNYNGLGSPYELSLNQTVYNGVLIGWTALWNYSSCYQVSNFDGVHWHVEMYQPVHYSCWHGWSAGEYLPITNSMGRVGSNNPSKSAC